MLLVTKLVNVHFTWNNRNIKWSFQTIYDNCCETKKYNIIGTKRTIEITKEQGNKLYQFLQRHFPNRKVFVIIDKENLTIHHVRVCDHYELRVNDQFAQSCNTLDEVREEKIKLEEKIKES